jgi:hypothetical protein
MSQLDNSLPDLIHITSLQVTHMMHRIRYKWNLDLHHHRYRGHLPHQMMKLEMDQSEEYTIVNLI